MSKRLASKHSGGRARRTPRGYIASLGVGMVLTGLAWFFLVRAAIDFGVLARHGQASAWTFTLAASLGGIVSLVLFLALLGRALRALGYLSEYKPRRAAARRRAR